MNQEGKLLFFHSPIAPADTQEAPPAPSAHEALAILSCLLRVEGFNPVTQLAGFLITEDPTYLPEDTAARALARRIGRAKLLEALIESYLSTHACSSSAEPLATAPAETPKEP